jgi:hypothetical protein
MFVIKIINEILMFLIIVAIMLFSEELNCMFCYIVSFMFE